MRRIAAMTLESCHATVVSWRSVWKTGVAAGGFSRVKNVQYPSVRDLAFI